MADFSLTMKRGDTRTLTITATAPDASNYSLVGKTVRFMGKRKLIDPDTSAVLNKSTGGNGITVLGSPNQHKATISIDADDTETLSKDTTLACEVQVVDGTNVYTVAEGKMKVKLDVIQASL